MTMADERSAGAGNGRSAAQASDPDVAARLDTALDAVRASTAATLAWFRHPDLGVELKADNSPVTIADRAAEEVLRGHLLRAWPDDGFLGEESGAAVGRSGFEWIVDPIDGTKSFLRGSPPWATLLALEVDGAVVLGMVSAPALGRRWWAVQGGGAFADGERIAVSQVDDLADALLCHADVLAYEYFDCGPEFAALTHSVWDRRGFGDFWGHMLVAEGVADVMVEPVLSVWDVAAVMPIVAEAGGRVTDRAGVVRPDGGNAVTTNGVLHDAVLAIVGRD